MVNLREDVRVSSYGRLKKKRKKKRKEKQEQGTQLYEARVL